MSRRVSRLLQRLIKSSSPNTPNGMKLAWSFVMVAELFIAREAEQRDRVLERRHIWHRRYLKFCFSRWRIASEFGSVDLKKKKSNFKPWKLRINSKRLQGYNRRYLRRCGRATFTLFVTSLYYIVCFGLPLC